jgi:xylulose-5-phosphate/fructose-6-phosphate phosphoketolase
MHQKMAAVVDECLAEIRAIQDRARNGGGELADDRNAHPQGWTGPAEVDGKQVEGTWRAHQVPLAEVKTNPAHLRQLEEWLRSYRPEELFDAEGAPRAELLGLVPAGPLRLGASPHANGGVLLRDLVLPDFRDYAVPVPARRGRGCRSRRGCSAGCCAT